MKKVLIFTLFFTLVVTGCQLYSAEATEEAVAPSTASNNEVKVEQEEKKDSDTKEEVKQEKAKELMKPEEKKEPVLKEEKKPEGTKELMKQGRKQEVQPKSDKDPVQAAQPKAKSTPSESKVSPVTQGKKKVDVNKNSTYKDEKHKFTLQFPSDWKDVKVNYGSWSKDTKASINFTVKIANEQHAIASIIVLDNDAAVNDYLSSGVFHKLGKVNNLTYLYIRRSEAPDKFYQDKYRKELKTLQQFVNTVPQVMKTFKFVK
jgi:hypothetical protein